MTDNLPTPEEIALVKALDERGVRWVKDQTFQYSTPSGTVGHITPDIAILELKIIIEVDGGHHVDTADQVRRDYLRDKNIRLQGWEVIRVRNKLINTPSELTNFAEQMAKEFKQETGELIEQTEGVTNAVANPGYRKKKPRQIRERASPTEIILFNALCDCGELIEINIGLAPPNWNRKEKPLRAGIVIPLIRTVIDVVDYFSSITTEGVLQNRRRNSYLHEYEWEIIRVSTDLVDDPSELSDFVKYLTEKCVRTREIFERYTKESTQYIPAEIKKKMNQFSQYMKNPSIQEEQRNDLMDAENNIRVLPRKKQDKKFQRAKNSEEAIYGKLSVADMGNPLQTTMNMKNKEMILYLINRRTCMNGELREPLGTRVSPLYYKGAPASVKSQYVDFFGKFTFSRYKHKQIVSDCFTEILVNIEKWNLSSLVTIKTEIFEPNYIVRSSEKGYFKVEYAEIREPLVDHLIKIGQIKIARELQRHFSDTAMLDAEIKELLSLDLEEQFKNGNSSRL